MGSRHLAILEGQIQKNEVEFDYKIRQYQKKENMGVTNWPSQATSVSKDKILQSREKGKTNLGKLMMTPRGRSCADKEKESDDDRERNLRPQEVEQAGPSLQKRRGGRAKKHSFHPLQL